MASGGRSRSAYRLDIWPDSSTQNTPAECAGTSSRNAGSSERTSARGGSPSVQSLRMKATSRVRMQVRPPLDPTCPGGAARHSATYCESHAHRAQAEEKNDERALALGGMAR